MLKNLREVGELPNGSYLYVAENEAGGRTYLSDECGAPHEVWDTCLTSPSTLLAALTEEFRQEIKDSRNSKAKI